MADVFNQERAKRLFGFIAAGGTTGAIIGPLLTMILVKIMAPPQLLLVSALLLSGTVVCIQQIIKRSLLESRELTVSPEPIGGNIFSGITAVLRSRYLLKICLYIFLLTTCATFLYFAQAHVIRDAFDQSSERTFIFALMDFLVNTLTLTIQILLTGKIIQKFGLPIVLALLPAVMFLGFITLSFAPILIVIICFQVFRRALNYSLTRPAREILYTVVSVEEKYKSKNFIDTLVYRGGDALSAWLFHGLRITLTFPPIMLIAAGVAAVWVGVGWLLGRSKELR